MHHVAKISINSTVHVEHFSDPSAINKLPVYAINGLCPKLCEVISFCVNDIASAILFYMNL